MIPRLTSEHSMDTTPTFLKYQPILMRSIFINAMPLAEPMHRMLPPAADAKETIFQYAPLCMQEIISPPYVLEATIPDMS